MKKGFTIILGFAVGLAAVTFAQVIVQRPQYPQSGLSYVGYGDAFPTTELFGGEIFVDVNGAGDAGPSFGIYDDVNTEWDEFIGLADLLASNNVWTGTNDFSAQTITLGTISSEDTTWTDDGSLLIVAVDQIDLQVPAAGAGNMLVRFDNVPAVSASGNLIELDATILQIDAGDLVRGVFIDLVTDAATTGGEFIAFDIDGIIGRASDDIAIQIGSGYDIDLDFGDPTVVFRYPDTANFNIRDAATDIEFILTDMPDHGAADATVAAMELDVLMDIMDAGDIQSALFIDVANAVHTGGTLYGLNIDGITAQAAEEAAIFIGATWDIDIHFGSATALVNWFETGNLTFSDYGGAVDLILTDMPDHGAADVTVAAMELDIAMDVMDVGDTQFGFVLDISDAAHTGGVLTAFRIDGITATGAVEQAIQIQAGWDRDIEFDDPTAILEYENLGNFTIRDDGVATSLILRDVPAAGTGADLMELDVTLSVMDGAGDLFRGFFLDVTRADHTNGTVVGFDADQDVNDVQSTDIAYRVAGLWDIGYRNAASTRRVDDPQVVDVADNAGGGDAAFTLEITGAYAEIDCQDAQGCDGTMLEAASVEGQLVDIVIVIQNAGSTTFIDQANVLTLSATPFNMNLQDALRLRYTGAIWVEVSRSVNP